MFDEGREGKGLAGDARTKMAFCKVNAPFLGNHVAESKSPGFFFFEFKSAWNPAESRLQEDLDRASQPGTGVIGQMSNTSH